MGCYNTYGGVQLKVEPEEDLLLTDYKVGRKVPISDGVYVGQEGVVVVTGGRLTAVFPVLHDKWGGDILPLDVVNPRNPVKQAAEEILKDKGK